MKLKDIAVGDIVAVSTYGDNCRLARVLEIGAFTKKVYSSSRSFYGHNTQIKGARVAMADYSNPPQYPETVQDTKIETVKVPGPFGGIHEVETEVPVTRNVTTWLRPQDIKMTGAQWTKRVADKAAADQAMADYKGQQQAARPQVEKLLAAAGVKAYCSTYESTVKLTYTDVLALVAAAKEVVA